MESDLFLVVKVLLGLLLAFLLVTVVSLGTLLFCSEFFGFRGFNMGNDDFSSDLLSFGLIVVFTFLSNTGSSINFLWDSFWGLSTTLSFLSDSIFSTLIESTEDDNESDSCKVSAFGNAGNIPKVVWNLKCLSELRIESLKIVYIFVGLSINPESGTGEFGTMLSGLKNNILRAL